MALALAVDQWLRRHSDSEGGQGLVEYALLLVLVSVVAIAAVTGLGTTIVTKLFTLSNSF